MSPAKEIHRAIAPQGNIVQKLYPKLTNKELQAVREKLDKYVEIVWEVMQNEEGWTVDGNPLC